MQKTNKPNLELIEKDFVCLNAHNDEDQSDRYPHPNAPMLVEQQELHNMT